MGSGGERFMFKMKRIAIFASGSGTNAENIARIFNNGSRINVSLVLTNRRNAGVIARMEPLGVETIYVPNSVWDNEPEKIVEILHNHNIDIVVLAGFMHYVATQIIAAYEGRILNIHPSLLPAYGGKGMYGHYVHEAVVAARETESGVTVHLVTDEMDKGEIIMQEKVTVTPEDTPQTLEAKIHPVEYSLYPRAIVKLVDRLDAAQLPPRIPSDLNEETDAAHEPTEKTEEGTDKRLQDEWAEALSVPSPAETLTPPIPEDAATPQNPCQTQAPHIPAQPLKQPVTPGATNAQCQPTEPMPPSYFVWAVVLTLACCLIPGIIAIIYSSQVSTKYYVGDIEGAKRSSRMTEIWLIITIVAGIVFSALYLPLSLLMQ